MSNHHHKSREEQINDRIQDEEQFAKKNKPYQREKLPPAENADRTMDFENNLIQRLLLSYEKYRKNGQSVLNNMPERSRNAKNSDPIVSRFIGEGNPTI